MAFAGLGGAIGALGSIGGAIGGAIASARANRKAQKELNQRKQDNEDWYNRRMAEDYTSRADVQNTFNKQKDMLQESLKNARATNAVAGGTDASEALAKQQAVQASADAAATVASNAADYKNAVENQYMEQKDKLGEEQQKIYKGQADIAAQAGAQVANAMGPMGTAIEDYLNRPKATNA